MAPNIPDFPQSGEVADTEEIKLMLVKNAAYRVVNVFVVLVTTILLSRLAGPAGYGLLTLFIANIAVFNLFTSFGTDSGLLYHKATDKLSRAKLMRLLFCVVAIQLLLLVFLEGGSWLIQGKPFLLEGEGARVYIIILLMLLSLSLSEKYAALLNGSGNYTLFSKLQLGTNLFTLLCIFCLSVWMRGKQPVYYIGAYALLSSIQCIVYITGFHRIKEKMIPKDGLQLREVKFFFTYALLTFFTNGIQFVAYRIDLWFIDYYYEDDALGLYGLAVRLVQLFWVLPLVAASILYPVIASAKGKPDIAQVLFVTRTLFTLQLAAAILIYATIPVAIHFVFGDAYAGAVSPFYWLMPGVLLFSIATIMAAYFSGTGRLWVNFFASLLCLTCIASADWLLVPAYGIKGAAIAGTIGYTATAIYYLIIFSIRHQVSLAKIMVMQPADWDRLKEAIAVTFKKK